MYLIYISSTLLIQFAVKSLSISLLFLMCLINRFTYAVFLKRRRNTLFHQSQKGFLAFILQSLQPRRSCDFPPFLKDRFRVCLNFLCAPLWPLVWILSHSGPYHHSLLFFNFLVDIPHVGLSAGSCFVFMYWSAASVSLII